MPTTTSLVTTLKTVAVDFHFKLADELEPIKLHFLYRNLPRTAYKRIFCWPLCSFPPFLRICRPLLACAIFNVYWLLDLRAPLAALLFVLSRQLCTAMNATNSTEAQKSLAFRFRVGRVRAYVRRPHPKCVPLRSLSFVARAKIAAF